MDNKNDTTDTPDTQDWPNTVRTRDELDSALEAGLKSGRGERTIDEFFESAIARLKKWLITKPAGRPYHYQNLSP